MTLNYQRVMNSLFKVVEESFEDTFESNVKKLDREVNKAQSRFFKKLVNKAIDVKSAPSLDEYTPVWKALNPKYLQEKRRLGQGTNFFKKTGELKTSLSSLKPLTVLGKPVVYFSPSGLSGTPGVRETRERWKGSSSKRKVVRDSRGRFASASNIPRYISASMTIDPYPNILKNAASEIINESDVLPDNIAVKLKAPNGRRVRPVFTNFLNWFLEKEIRKAAERVV